MNITEGVQVTIKEPEVLVVGGPDAGPWAWLDALPDGRGVYLHTIPSGVKLEPEDLEKLRAALSHILDSDSVTVASMGEVLGDCNVVTPGEVT